MSHSVDPGEYLRVYLCRFHRRPDTKKDVQDLDSDEDSSKSNNQFKSRSVNILTSEVKKPLTVGPHPQTISGECKEEYELCWREGQCSRRY